VILVSLQWLLWVGAPILNRDWATLGFLGGVVCGVLVLLWWLFFSRAPWSERLGVVVLMIAAVYASSFVVHRSISNGMMGLMLFFIAIPPLSLALVAAAAAGRHLSRWTRHGVMGAAIVVACAALTLIRTDGVTGDGASDFHLRWTPTAEDRLLARSADEPLAPAPAAPGTVPSKAGALKDEPAGARVPESSSAAPPPAASGSAAETSKLADPAPLARRSAWPGFRGPDRDGVASGTHIETDWSRRPPEELWRRPIGPGWSSFAISGPLAYTQEQRGEEELVTAYRLTDGRPVWKHADPVRFYESNGGPGPRGTPTVHGDRVFALGATGILNALDAGTGRRIWSRNAATDTSTEIPGWGFASSPLVAGDVVIVALSGQLAAYDIQTGEPRWYGPTGGSGYSSPHLATIDGVPQVLLLRGSRTISVSPEDGSLLWEHTWQPGVGIVQPALADGADVLITTGDAMGGLGIRRVSVSHGPTGWNVQERWTSRGLKPYFNDLVVHEGHAFGFDGSILACIDLGTGERAWKGGRYGHGQMVLLPDQDLLLVLSEEGELALVRAVPDGFAETARFKAIEGKTWNHPVLVGDLLLVRNGEEMAAFRLPGARRTTSAGMR
jgi:outer membrane protein assembly factor BamB